MSLNQTPIEQLITEQPMFHAWPDGKPANWSIASEALRYLYECLSPGMVTLETGAGQTTVAFAIAGTQHTCITPDEDQASRIRDYCSRRGISESVTFIFESSDTALSSGRAIPEELDFVLIDGAHRFPFPILDWYFTQERLRVGGIVAVDDFPMPSVKILHDFLMGEDEWLPVKLFQRTSFFRRERRTVSQWDWADQKINKSALWPQQAPEPKGILATLRRRLRRDTKHR
jgi:predicted O-methyltransferase YrrM